MLTWLYSRVKERLFEDPGAGASRAASAEVQAPRVGPPRPATIVRNLNIASVRLDITHYPTRLPSFTGIFAGRMADFQSVLVLEAFPVVLEAAHVQQMELSHAVL